MPVIVHCRYSHARALDMLVEAGIERAVFHWYAGPRDLLDTILENGYFISATPAVRYSVKHRDAVRAAPLERLLLESDCPVDYRGGPSSPSDVLQSLREVARLKELPPVQVARVTTENVARFLAPTRREESL